MDTFVPFPTLDDLPKHFYKYRSLRGDEMQRTLDIIENNRLFWSSPLDFNDPFDCLPVYSMEASQLKKESALRKIYRDHMPNLQKAALKKLVQGSMRLSNSDFQARMTKGQKELLAETAVCCLTTDAENILMWTHYADSHSGICLRFTPLSKDAELVNTGLMHFEYALPVQYTDRRPVINVLNRSPEENLTRALLTKADFWSYESEWRMIGYRRGPGLFEFPAVCLDAIIFGERVKTEDREKIMESVSKRKNTINIINCAFDDEHFKLNLGVAQA